MVILSEPLIGSLLMSHTDIAAQIDCDGRGLPEPTHHDGQGRPWLWVRISAAGQGEGVELAGAVVSEWVFD